MLRPGAVLLFLFALCSAADPQQPAIGINQNAVMFIEVECENPANGALMAGSGSGFNIHKTGYVLTAYHVVSCYDRENRKQLRPTKLTGRFGNPWAPKRELVVSKKDEQADIAIVQVLDTSQEYPALTACALHAPEPGTQFTAAGFPEGSGFQPVLVIYGNTMGSFWQAAADFADGMSGGPVVHRGSVVGVIRGGRKNVQAIRAITPLHLGGSMIRDTTGVDIADCRTSRPPDPNGDCKGRWVTFTDQSVFPPSIEKKCL